MASIERLVAEQPFFEGIDAAHLRVIADCATEVSFEAGRYIFRVGDESAHFYTIAKGKVSVEIMVPGEGAIPLQCVGPGEVLGWSWLVPPHTKQFDARVIEDTQALMFDARCLRTKCEQDQKLGFELMRRTARVLGQRLQAARFQLLDVYGVPR